MPAYLVIFFSLTLAALLSAVSIPVVIKVSKLKNLYDEPNERKVNKNIVPTLGGISIFLSLFLSVIITSKGYAFEELRYILAAIIIMFFIGLKDDLLIIAPNKKLLAQITAAILLITLADIRISSLHGFLGIHEINYFVSFLLSVFVYVVIINAFNLIDGIDGLASGVAIITSLAFGTWFYLIGQIEYAILSFALIGSLGAFFYYNVFSKENKIFMGDTGSLILGVVLTVLMIRFLEMNIENAAAYTIESAPAVAFGVLIVPLYDTLRVFGIRILSRKSPFSPDKNHVHHKMLELGYSHKQATFRILLINVFFIGFNYLLQNIGEFQLLIFNLVFGTFFSLIPAYILFKRSDHPDKRYFIFHLKPSGSVFSNEKHERQEINKDKEKEKVFH